MFGVVVIVLCEDSGFVHAGVKERSNWKDVNFLPLDDQYVELKRGGSGLDRLADHALAGRVRIQNGRRYVQS